jgi:hypothetical protein
MNHRIFPNGRANFDTVWPNFSPHQLQPLLTRPANIINVIPANAGIQWRALRAHLTGFRVKPGMTKFILFPCRIDRTGIQIEYPD